MIGVRMDRSGVAGIGLGLVGGSSGGLIHGHVRRSARPIRAIGTSPPAISDETPADGIGAAMKLSKETLIGVFVVIPDV